MKLLRRHELHLVKPKFQPMVQAAWDNGENVPFGETLLSDAPPDERDIVWAKNF